MKKRDNNRAKKTNNYHPVPASTIVVGDILWTVYGEKKVVEINQISSYGLYNPLTTNGTIVVNNGIITSTYTSPNGKSNIIYNDDNNNEEEDDTDTNILWNSVITGT